MSNLEDPVANLLAVVLSGRADQFVDAVAGEAAPLLAPELRGVKEALSAVASAEPALPPSPGLRSRIVRSLAARSAPPRRALVIIDMLNDHLTPGGPVEVPRARDIVPALVTRIEDARRDGIPIIYVVDEHSPDDSDLDAWGAHNLKGTYGGAIWAPLAPHPEDRVVHKATYSAFTRSDLEDVLAGLHVDTLVLTGCLTEVGIAATAHDALQRGYAIEVPHDSQAGATELNERVALGVLALLPPYGPAREALLAR